MKTTVVAGQPSWLFASDKVEAAVTQTGGHLAPVRFRLGRRIVQPYAVAPWAEEKLGNEFPPILQALRGDFFCAPFGGNDTVYRGEKYPPHGEPANREWKFESLSREEDGTSIHLSLKTKIRRGQVDKTLRLRNGHTAIYSQHVLAGMRGKMSFGHHANLRFPDEPECGHISTSKIRFGQVAPILFEDPAKGGYSSLKTGATFSRLDKVPSVLTGTADVTRYPARRGFEDLLMFVHEDRPDFAWTAVAFPKQRYVWFALKDPRVLRSTVFWITNGGRHYAPWSGRHINVMGLEEVTSYFHYGLAESAQPNDVSRQGWATSMALSPAKPLAVNYIMGVAEIPEDFERVKSIKPGKDSITLVSTGNHRVQVPLDTEFLYSKPL